MIFSLQEARDILRIDGEDNDMVIAPLVEAIPPYLLETAGYSPDEGEDGEELFSSLAKLAGKFLLWLWYYGESADVAKMERVLLHVLAALKQPRKADG